MLYERATAMPVGWSRTPIGDIATESKRRAGHNPALSVLSVTKHRGIVRSDQYFNKRVYGKNTSNYKVVQPGQFAYATIHLNEGSIGRLRASTPGIVSPMYTVFDVRGDVDPCYLLAVLKSTPSLSVYKTLTQGTVNRRGGISFRTLSRLLLHHPPLPEQRKIAAILSSVDDAIEKTQAVIDQVQIVKRGLMQKFFTRGRRGQATTGGILPAGWRVRCIAEVARVVGGVSFPREYQGNRTALIPFFKVSDMNTPGNERGLRVAANTIDDRSLRQVLKGTTYPAGTVVFPKVGAALLTNKRRYLSVSAIFDNNVMGLVPTACDPRFLYHAMHVIDFSKHVQPGAVPSVNGTLVASIRFPIPPLSHQRTIAAMLSSVDDTIEMHHAVVDGLHDLRRGLMSVLLTGTLRVILGPDDP